MVVAAAPVVVLVTISGTNLRYFTSNPPNFHGVVKENYPLTIK
jgi:hypothetical protein